MSKIIELAKKLKALADRGVDGEKVNAAVQLEKILKKHGLKLEDIEEDKKEDYMFTATGINNKLLYQIAKRVNYNLRVFDVKPKLAKAYGKKGNVLIECTVAEFVEISQMFDLYKALYEKEEKIFYSAFLTANDLLARPPKEEQKTTEDLTPEELEEWRRAQGMADNIKKGQLLRALNK